MTADRTVPTATYRLQLQPGFPFAAAERAVPYLASFGVSHLHLSPVLEARPGSSHGYDIVDHTAVRAELGGERGLRALARTARAHGLGLIADIVPNHMAVPVPERLNGPLWEVLRDGPVSRYARWFDIDWAEHGRKVLLPVLGGPLGDEWERLRPGDDGVLRYYDHAFPLRPGTERLPLAELLDAQWYRLGWWRLARTELNYRRFFTISELIAVRVEDPEVFDATHGTLLGLLRDGVLDGLRVDHPDGLADPGGYLRALDEAVRAATGGEGRWTVVEKILARDEPLPAHWPVAGTTGYDALHHIDGLFVDPDGLAKLTAAYRSFTAAPPDRGGDWTATVRRAARHVVTHELAAEVERLTRTASRICAAAPPLRDHAPWALRTAIRALLVRLPVYRPYATVDAPAGEADGQMLHRAAEDARTAFPASTVEAERRAVETVRDAALGRLGDGPDHRDFCARFAQTAAALRAKSVEDTAFYRYTPLLSAAEVGGDPGHPAVSPEEFHAFAARLLRDWPATGTVLSTHDTKRSADVRARIAALTETPARWARLLADLSAQPEAPDPQLAWTAWQTALGLGAADAERLVPAVLKAVREAGLHTTWTEQNAAYEDAVTAFLAAGPGNPASPAWAALDAFGADIAAPARVNTLGAALLHLTMPGVPDLYTDTERGYRALVDPDNRRPPTPDTPATDGLSAEKLLLTRAALRLRRDHPEWFGPGSAYTPLIAGGPAAAHCLAFLRTDRESRDGGAITVTTRLSRRLAEAGGWDPRTRLPLPPGSWRDLLTDRTAEGPAPLGDLLDRLPVALLVRT
ncbi:malto-oligosyltrehalose synthase [Streptomyces botrytidirepellens]|uniref:Malto-oligosyltrehalose synthase n=1 Tax=Streptomyces botrytidirepellens TaxID=2486417 RepID=A0A3M8VQU2_9ACTN|nr:malto-oligosyltrehalose synthase [Streptomyces botrytidirepellens]RNG19009.1 malto-oligosyltrehalose synthase [Streptomyces botrytidirepellens]